MLYLHLSEPLYFKYIQAITPLKIMRILNAHSFKIIFEFILQPNSHAAEIQKNMLRLKQAAERFSRVHCSAEAAQEKLSRSTQKRRYQIFNKY